MAYPGGERRAQLGTIYHACIAEDEGGSFLVQFYDVPEALTDGTSLAEALVNARDALAAAIEAYLVQGRALPARSEIDPASLGPRVTIHEIELQCECAPKLHV